MSLSSANISSGEEYHWLEAIPSIDGYKPIGVIGFNTGHIHLKATVCRKLNNNVQFYAINDASITLTGIVPQINMLYLKA